MVKKNTRRSPTKKPYFTIITPRRVVPVRIEGVRKLRSKWVAEIKHPRKKNVRIWLGSYATQEEASKVYQSKKMEHEEIKLQATAKKGKTLVVDQEVVGARMVSDAESSSDDQKVVGALMVSDAESSSDDHDVAMKGLDVADQAMKVVSDDQAMKDVFDDRAVPLLSKQQVPIKIEGVRMKRSKWVAEIKHPKKKNVRIWLGSYATQEEASRVYQSKKMEHEEIKLQGTVKKGETLVDDQEVVGALVVSDDHDVVMKGLDVADQAMKVVLDDQPVKDVFDDRAVPLPSKQQAPIKIEGVRMRKSKWVAEIKHPKKKNVRIWLGSYATQEEASQVYQLKKMEHEKLKLQTIAEKDKLVDDQEVVSAPAESNAEPLSDDPDVMMKVVNCNDQAMKVVDADDKNIVHVLKESNAESQSDDRDVMMNVVGSDDQATKIVHSDDQAERSLSRKE